MRVTDEEQRYKFDSGTLQCYLCRRSKSVHLLLTDGSSCILGIRGFFRLTCAILWLFLTRTAETYFTFAITNTIAKGYYILILHLRVCGLQ
jgi:hypothetical protein